MGLQVTVWNEYRSHNPGDWMNDEQRRQAELAAEVYPDGIHATIASFLEGTGHDVETALFSEPEHGLTTDVLERTDVLVWWSHYLNDEVDDDVVDRVYQHVINGMGLLVLHSARRSKIFMRLMGTSCGVRGYRDADEMERLWVTDPAHPIVEGLEEQYIEIPESQIVAEPFDIPEPASVPLVSWIKGGEIFRSGCCFQRGNGKVFFLGPGHETHPVYHQPAIQQIIMNAVEWACPVDAPDGPRMAPTESLEPPEGR